MNGDTLLHRQVHPSWVQGDGVTSQAFKPTNKDIKQLSVYDGGQITAENAWGHYTQSLGKLSVGVVSVSIQECKEQELTVKSDPERFPEHMLIDYSIHTNSGIKRIARDLRRIAMERGWQYQNKGT